MGFVLWALLSLGVATSSYVAAALVAEKRSSLERVIAAMLFGTACVLVLTMGLALAGVFSRGVLAAVALVVIALPVVHVWRSVDARGRLERSWREDCDAPFRVLHDAWRTREVAVAVVPLAFGIVALSCWCAWVLPSWSWDCVWYHTAMTHTVVQSGALRWEPTHVAYVNAYPRAVEMLGAWHVLLQGTKRLDDVAQIPFAFLGAAAVAAFARRLAVPRAMSAALGAAWVALPSVALELHTTHADVAAGSLFLVAAYHLTTPRFDAHALLVGALALGLYIATKVTGLFHAVIVLPVILVRATAYVHAARGARRWPAVLELCGATFLVAALGAFTPLRNMLHEHNPFWPARITVPFVNATLPGVIDAADIAGPPAFFGAPGAFMRMVDSWFSYSEIQFPDVRTGGFGLLFPYLTLPTLVLATVLMPFRRGRAQVVTLVAVALVAVLVPAAWWGRFTLGLPAMALVAFGLLHRRVPFAFARTVASLVFVALAAMGYARAWPGYRVIPRWSETARDAETRLRSLHSWMWPMDARQTFLAEVRKGDVLAYDESIGFLDDLWSDDLSNRATPVRYVGDADAYLATLVRERARWVAVGQGSTAALVLSAQSHLFRRAFEIPYDRAVMFVRTDGAL